jgi:hypothetical protein
MPRLGVLVNGRMVLKPSVIPTTDSSAMIPNTPQAAPLPLMFGNCEGGDPTKAHTFNNFDEAKRILRGGKVLAFISRTFNPSPDQQTCPGAPGIQFIRISSTASRASVAFGFIPIAAPA